MDPLVASLGIPTGLAGWNIVQKKAPADFPALTKDPVLQREIAYFRQHAPKALTAKALLSDQRLQDFVLTAYGMQSQKGMTALLRKVLESNTNDSASFARRMSDSRFRQLASAFNYGTVTTPATPAVASSAEVAVDGLFQNSNFSSFSGSFGGVTVSGADISGATTWQGLASKLQAAFQKADGGRTDIKVALDGLKLKFTDAKGRGTAGGFTWTPNPANTGAAPIASAPASLVAGSIEVPAVGGPKVTDSSFIDQVVQKYTQAQFEVVVGNTSNELRQALYAKRQLPNVTNWYSVIADRPLASVIQTVLGLPDSFGKIDVDAQARMLGRRMKVTDFQDPAKLTKLLNRYIAMSGLQTQTGAATAAQLLDGSSNNGIINLNLPAQGTSTFSSASAAAMILSSAIG